MINAPGGARAQMNDSVYRNSLDLLESAERLNEVPGLRESR